MRTRDILIIWIAVRRTAEVQPREDRDTSGPIWYVPFVSTIWLRVMSRKNDSRLSRL